MKMQLCEELTLIASANVHLLIHTAHTHIWCLVVLDLSSFADQDCSPVHTYMKTVSLNFALDLNRNA